MVFIAVMGVCINRTMPSLDDMWAIPIELGMPKCNLFPMKWLWITVKITLLPYDACSILSNDITLAGYIQQSMNCIWKEKYMVKGAYVSQYHLKIFLWGCNSNRNSAGAMVSITISSTIFHMLLLFGGMRKITIVFCYQKGKLLKLTWRNNHI